MLTLGLHLVDDRSKAVVGHSCDGGHAALQQAAGRPHAWVATFSVRVADGEQRAHGADHRDPGQANNCTVL